MCNACSKIQENQIRKRFKKGMNGWFHRLHGSHTQRFRCNFWVRKLKNDELLEVVRKRKLVKIEWVSNAFYNNWCYTVKAHLGSYLTCWMQIGVPLGIFYQPPTARGIEIPQGNSSVCLSNCTVQTMPVLLDSNSLAEQRPDLLEPEQKPNLRCFLDQLLFCWYFKGLVCYLNTKQIAVFEFPTVLLGFKNNGCKGNCRWAILRPCLGFSKVAMGLDEGYNPF